MKLMNVFSMKGDRNWTYINSDFFKDNWGVQSFENSSSVKSYFKSSHKLRSIIEGSYLGRIWFGRLRIPIEEDLWEENFIVIPTRPLERSASIELHFFLVQSFSRSSYSFLCNTNFLCMPINSYLLPHEVDVGLMDTVIDVLPVNIYKTLIDKLNRSISLGENVGFELNNRKYVIYGLRGYHNEIIALDVQLVGSKPLLGNLIEEISTKNHSINRRTYSVRFMNEAVKKLIGLIKSDLKVFSKNLFLH